MECVFHTGESFWCDSFWCGGSFRTWEGRWFRFKVCLGKCKLGMSIRRSDLTANCSTGAARLPTIQGFSQTEVTQNVCTSTV